MKKFKKSVINFADKIIDTHVEVISDLLICSAGTGIDFAIVDVKNSIKAFDRIKNGGFSNNIISVRNFYVEVLEYLEYKSNNKL